MTDKIVPLMKPRSDLGVRTLSSVAMMSVAIGAIWLGLAYGGLLGRVAVVAVIGGCGVSLAIDLINSAPGATSFGVVVLLVTLAVVVGLWNLRVGQLRGR